MAHLFNMSLSLLEFCKRNNTTVAEVARAADLDPKWLYKVAKGERGFSLETAAKIEAATARVVTISDLNATRQAWLAANPKPAKPSKRAGAGKKPRAPFARSPAEEAA